MQIILSSDLVNKNDVYQTSPILASGFNDTADQVSVSASPFEAVPIQTDVMPYVSGTVQQEEAVSQSNTSQKSIMNQIKTFISTKPWQALAVIIAVGLLIGFYASKLTKRRKY